jgi:hypothetical protein
VRLTNYINNTHTRRKIYGIAGAFLILAIPYFIMLADTHNHIETEQSLCPFKLLTGLPCPGCGITKSLVFIYKGDLEKSFYYHLFGPFVFLFCIIAIIVLVTELINQKDYFHNLIYNRKLAWFLGSTLAIYHVTRLVYFISNNSITSILHQSIWRYV